MSRSTRRGRSTCSCSTRSCRSSPTATCAARSPTRSTAKRSSPPPASAPPRRAGRSCPPSLQYYAADTPLLNYSLSAAKAELAQSKYPHGFKTKLLISGGVQKWAEFAQIIQQSLAALNITVAIEAPDNAAFHTQFEAFNYDMSSTTRSTTSATPTRWHRSRSTSRMAVPRRYWSSYNSPAAIKLVHRGRGGVQQRQTRRPLRADPGDRRERRAVRPA